jgi:hypothetical protein
MNDRERRSMGPVELRAAADGKPPQLVGYAAVFNSRSEDLGGFREIILPGAFDRALREGHDVFALVNHDPNKVLSRTTATPPTVLSVDEHGLRVEIPIDPDDPDGGTTLRRVAAGKLNRMSFAFRTVADQWRTEEGEPIRELTDLELFDVSVVTYPAYPATEVSTRALEKAREVALPVTPPRPVPLERLTRLAGLHDREED